MSCQCEEQRLSIHGKCRVCRQQSENRYNTAPQLPPERKSKRTKAKKGAGPNAKMKR